MTQGPDATLTLDRPRLDFATSIETLRFGRANPSLRVTSDGLFKALRTPEGAATLALTKRGATLEARAFGEGAAWAIARVPALIGDDDDPSGFAPKGELVRDLAARFPGLRLVRAPWLDELVVGKILEQRVTWGEATTSYGYLVRALGEPAPGPFDLRLPPALHVYGSQPDARFRDAGIDHQRGATLRRLGQVAHHIEKLRLAERPQIAELLGKIPGIGPWTRAQVLGMGLGDPDAVPTGDAHLPSLVGWYFERDLAATDERMLTLLEPYKGQRFRVIRLLFAARLPIPRFGPAPASGPSRRRR